MLTQQIAKDRVRPKPEQGHKQSRQDERVFCVRGPSRSGKTSVSERLIPLLSERGFNIGYVKRTHHELDLPNKSSSRIWESGPGAMVIHAGDRVQTTHAAGSREVGDLAARFGPEIDIILVETHTSQPYPTILAGACTPEPDEQVIGRWEMDSIEADVAGACEAITEIAPPDTDLRRALRAAAAHHGGHACAGLILGTRLARYGTRVLGVEVPDKKKRLVATVEIDRCAADAVQSVTGCRPGKRTLRLLDYGKLAATFVDGWSGRAVRVAVRADLREVAARLALPGEDRHQAQRRVYLALPDDELFTLQDAAGEIPQFDLPGPPRRRVNCMSCGEEVSDGRDVMTEEGPYCRPCAAGTVKGAHQ